MNERPTTPSDQCSAADWLRWAAQTLRQATFDVTPGLWQGAGSDVGSSALQQYRTTVQHFPTSTAFPAIRPTDALGEPGLPQLRDPLETFENALQPVHPRVPAHARRTVMVSPLIAEPLATLLDSLAKHLEVTIQAGGSAEEEPYRAAIAVAKIILDTAADLAERRTET